MERFSISLFHECRQMFLLMKIWSPLQKNQHFCLFVEAVRCPSFHNHLLDRLEGKSKHYFSHHSQSVRALHAYALKVFNTEVCNLGLTSYSNTALICEYRLAALTTTNNASILLFLTDKWNVVSSNRTAFPAPDPDLELNGTRRI